MFLERGRNNSLVLVMSYFPVKLVTEWNYCNLGKASFWLEYALALESPKSSAPGSNFVLFSRFHGNVNRRPAGG